jgi:hypothetical protein
MCDALGMRCSADAQPDKCCDLCRSMPSLQTDSVDSLFSQPSFGGGGAFAITLGGGSGCGSPIKEWPLTSRLAVALPAASPPASVASTPSKARAGGSLQKPGRGSASLASSPQNPPLLPSAPHTASARGSLRSRLHAAAAGSNSSRGDMTEAALEAEIWAAERPAMAAAAAGKRAATFQAPPAAGTTDPQAEGAAEVAPQGWLERVGLRFDDAEIEAQYVRWHGLQAQKVSNHYLTVVISHRHWQTRGRFSCCYCARGACQSASSSAAQHPGQSVQATLQNPKSTPVACSWTAPRWRSCW